MFQHSVELKHDDLDACLRALPARAGVFAVHFSNDAAHPYVTQSADIRRRVRRLMESSTTSSKRLSLRREASRVSYTSTGSQLEAALLLYGVLPDARQRLKLRPPPLIRFAVENRYPRCYISSRLSLRAADSFFGPFASRVGAESYLEAVLDLFLLRRCQPDLAPDPAFPGCIYSEMHKCLAPCFAGCTDERYADEAAGVLAFLQTGGASLLEKTGAKRDASSAELNFEQAAVLHTRYERVKAVTSQAPEIARAVSSIRAVVMEVASEPDTVNLFLFQQMRFVGPVAFSTLGMRHANEQSTSSSLFAQPLHVAPVALDASSESMKRSETLIAPEDRLGHSLTELEQLSAEVAKRITAVVGSDHLALLQRWFYRPDTKRSGEIFLVPLGEQWPVRRMLRAISRVYLGRTGVQAAPQHTLPP